MSSVQAAGLSGAEAARRLLEDGPNTLPASRPRDTLHIAVEVVREPMFLLLVGGAGIYRSAQGESRVALKGAAETVLALCEMDADARVSAMDEVTRAAQRGLRLLAVAESPWNDTVGVAYCVYSDQTRASIRVMTNGRVGNGAFKATVCSSW